MSHLELTTKQQQKTETLEKILGWTEGKIGQNMLAYDDHDINNAITILCCMQAADKEKRFYDVWVLSKQMRKDVRAAISKTLMEAYDSK